MGRGLYIALALVGFFVACNGPADNTAGDAGPGSSGSAGGDGGGIESSGGSSGTTGSDGGVSDSGGMGGVAGIDGNGGAAGQGESNPGSVLCGDQQCDLANNDCCYDQNYYQQGWFTCFDREIGASGCVWGVVLHCDGASDCPDGQRCCGNWGPFGGPPVPYSGIQCAAGCDAFDFEFCDPADPDPCSKPNSTCEPAYIGLHECH
jgi:hypothetical protein